MFIYNYKYIYICLYRIINIYIYYIYTYVYIPFINTVLINMYTHKIYICEDMHSYAQLFIWWYCNCILLKATQISQQLVSPANFHPNSSTLELSGYRLPELAKGSWIFTWINMLTSSSTCDVPISPSLHVHNFFYLGWFFLERKTPLKTLEKVITCDFSWNFCLATSNSRSWHCELSLKVRYSHRCLFLVMVHSQNGSVLHVAIFGPQIWCWAWSWDILMSSILAGQTNNEP